MKILAIIFAIIFVNVSMAFDWQSYSLAELTKKDSENKAMFSDVSKLIEEAGYKVEEFRVNYSCKENMCEINLYPKELDFEKEKYARYLGCPLKYCATIEYSLSKNKIEGKTHWK